MTKITEYVLIVTIIFLGMYAVLSIADRAYDRVDTINQEQIGH